MTSSRARRVDQLGKAARHGVVTAGGAGADHLGGDLSRLAEIGHGLDEQIADVFAAFAHPVGHEQILAMARNRAFPASHDVDPGRIVRLDAEFGVGDVLASGPGDAIVDHQQLAVVAKIDAPANESP